MDLYKKISAFNQFNYCGARIPLKHNGLRIEVWRNKLVGYHDTKLIEFLEFGWPLGLDPDIELISSFKNHPSSTQFFEPVDKFIIKQITSNALAGPCVLNCTFLTK